MVVINGEAMVVEVFGFIGNFALLWELEAQNAHSVLEGEGASEAGFVLLVLQV